MMWRLAFVCLLLFIPILASGQANDSATGSAEGIVLDSSGKPVAKATVFVGTLANGPRTETDTAGRFVLKGLPSGDIGLQAYKESDGYPYDMFSFFLMPGERLPRFNLSAGQTVSNVVIQLGEKAAFLKLEIRDELGALVDGDIKFSRPDLGQYGDYRRNVSSKDLILVPPVPFRVTVEKDGFAPWHYGAERWRDKEGLITLKPGAIKDLVIVLHKIK
jgi:hypothetical protein